MDKLVILFRKVKYKTTTET